MAARKRELGITWRQAARRAGGGYGLAESLAAIGRGKQREIRNPTVTLPAIAKALDLDVFAVEDAYYFAGLPDYEEP